MKWLYCNCNSWSELPEGFNELKHFGRCPACNRLMYLNHTGQPKDIGLNEKQEVKATKVNQKDVDA